jgi:hypothetical protein
MAKALTPCALILLLAGCAVRTTTGGIVGGQGIIPRAKIVVVPIEDGRERGGDVGTGSGSAVTAALRDGLLARGFAPFVADHRSFEDALEQARRLGYDYVLRGQITEWEDNATEWSSKADSAGLSIELFDLTPSVIASGTHRIKGAAVDMMPQTPDRFIPELVTAALGRALGQHSRP